MAFRPSAFCFSPRRGEYPGGGRGASGLTRPTARSRVQVVHEVGLDGFLAHRVGEHGGKPITVADVVKYLAHVEGGVHAGEPTSEVDRNLARLAAAVNLGGLTAPVRVMRSIGRITRDALTPLREAVESSRTERRD